MSPTQVCNRLRLLRTARNVTALALAEQIGMNQQTIEYIERGDHRVSLELALQITQALGMNIETVFSLNPFPDVFAAPVDPAVRVDRLTDAGPALRPDALTATQNSRAPRSTPLLPAAARS